MALLEGGDAETIAEGEEVTLKNWGNVKVTKVDKDPDGELCFVLFCYFLFVFCFVFL